MSNLYIILVNAHLSFVPFVIWIDAYKWEQNVCIISNSGYIFCAIPACEAVVLLPQYTRFEEVWGLEKEKYYKKDGVEHGVGWVERERHACICKLAYGVYLLGSQPPLSYYLILT